MIILAFRNFFNTLAMAHLLVNSFADSRVPPAKVVQIPLLTLAVEQPLQTEVRVAAEIATPPRKSLFTTRARSRTNLQRIWAWASAPLESVEARPQDEGRDLLRSLSANRIRGETLSQLLRAVREQCS